MSIGYNGCHENQFYQLTIIPQFTCCCALLTQQSFEDIIGGQLSFDVMQQVSKL